MPELSTTSRLLQLLSLLQTHRFWSGTELADRLEVSGRTLRRDIERLRDLGYRLSSTRGSDGGYQLEAGADLPPLVLTDDEAVALAVALRTAASTGPIVGLAETNVAVLAKLEQVLPTRLRARVRALQSAMVLPAPAVATEAAVDPEILARLAFACRDAQRLRLDYVAGDGSGTARRVEPLALVPRSLRWYLVCWDLDRDAWRTLRVDRIDRISETRMPFTPRPLPAPDAAAFVAKQFRESPVHTADVTIEANLDETTAYLAGYAHSLTADGAHRTRWHIEAERLETLVTALVWLPWPFIVHGSPELMQLTRTFSERLRAASGE